mmetsp:Transcript_14644/g.33294  ORF Transcript_14644/g.33294 Transcript_14644/m.33294 type:complete len:100 (-) Transcript_14644:281-580(-)
MLCSPFVCQRWPGTHDSVMSALSFQTYDEGCQDANEDCWNSDVDPNVRAAISKVLHSIVVRDRCRREEGLRGASVEWRIWTFAAALKLASEPIGVWSLH